MAYTDPRSIPPGGEQAPEQRQRDPLAVTIWLTRAVAYVAYAVFIVAEFILLQGFVLKLLGADTDAAYVRWAYRNLDRVMAPFRGIFTPVELDGNSVLDTSILFAMVIYGLVLLLLRVFLDWLTYRLRKVEHERQELVRQQDLARRQAALAAAAPSPWGPSAVSQPPPPGVVVPAPPPGAPPSPPPPPGSWQA
jgi:hypothetical protein